LATFIILILHFEIAYNLHAGKPQLIVSAHANTCIRLSRSSKHIIHEVPERVEKLNGCRVQNLLSQGHNNFIKIVSSFTGNPLFLGVADKDQVRHK
jgi:hypothetical protein